MARKRLTQLFPFLLPLRQWQRKQCCYLQMRRDGNKYADTLTETLLPHQIFADSVPMLNQNSGFSMQYQYNKVHNLKLAARCIHKVLIRPQEVFSFFWLVRDAERETPYKDGLNFQNGKIVPSRGGGLCMLSNLLFWCFLHTPLTILERHGHGVESFPSTTEQLPSGTDATISLGWRDLRLRNDTDNCFQIELAFDDSCMYCRILAESPVGVEYSVYNPAVRYLRRQGKIYQVAEVWRKETDRLTGQTAQYRLYTNECEITYPLPEGTEIIEE